MQLEAYIMLLVFMQCEIMFSLFMGHNGITAYFFQRGTQGSRGPLVIGGGGFSIMPGIQDYSMSLGITALCLSILLCWFNFENFLNLLGLWSLHWLALESLLPRFLPRLFFLTQAVVLSL